MSEQWRPVVGWEGLYEVSDRGRIRGLDRWIRNSHATFLYRGRILKLPIGKRGYPTVRLCNGPVQRTYNVHRLLMAAFVGPRPNGFDICHNNGIRTDNRLDNLRYDSRSENAFDSVRHGTNKWSRKTQCPKGHEYTADNTYVNFRRSGPKEGRPFRTCRRCAIDRAAAHKALRRISERASA